MKTAKQAMTYALVGFGLCLAAWLLIQIVASALGYTETWWKIDMDCADFGETQKKIDCKQSGGTWNPETNECKCDHPGEELFKNKCVPSNLVAKIKECEAGQNQEWDYSNELCKCNKNYAKNQEGNCVPIACFYCSNKSFYTCKELSNGCKQTLEKINGAHCIPDEEVCGKSENFPKTGQAEGKPCGTEMGSICVKTSSCISGEDWGGIRCAEGLKCCDAVKFDPQICQYCHLLKGEPILQDIPHDTREENERCEKYKECKSILAEDNHDHKICVPNPKYCEPGLIEQYTYH